MPHFQKLTPNLLVASVERSLAFYVDTLGFERGLTVPEQSPYVFASVTGGPIEIFFNDAATAVKEYPAFGGHFKVLHHSEVIAQLVVQLLIDLCSVKERSQPQWNCI